MKNDHQDFIAACLERSREVPLAVHMDLKYGDCDDYPDCTCTRDGYNGGMLINEDNPCRYHTTFFPLANADHIRRIRKLDINLKMVDDYAEEPDQYFEDAFYHYQLFAFPLPALESLNLRVCHALEVDAPMELPNGLFCWRFLPPTELRHFTLHGCYGSVIQAVCNLTSLELSGEEDAFDPVELNTRTFLPLISNSPSLQSLHLSHFDFPDRTELSLVTPVKLSKLKFLQLMDIHGLSGFSGLVEVPALKTISSLWIAAQDPGSRFDSDRFLIRAEGDDGFQLSYDTSSGSEVMSDWLDITRNADPSPSLVRFEGEVVQRETEMEVSPFPLFVNATILEVGASFAKSWYHGFWEDIEKVGPQLTTLRLEVVEGMDPAVTKSLKRLAKVRFKKGMPLTKLERMKFEGVNEEDDVKAKRLWEEFRVGLGVDQYLTAQ